MKIAFISDLHLSPNTLDKNQIFFDLMQEWATKLDALYILGDFFDYWLGDDDNNKFISEIKNCFKYFTQTTPIYFIGGNHDFGLGSVFARETGITILKDCSLLKTINHNILLTHGDVFCTLDISHQRMKKILQNPFTKFLLRRVPLSWRYKLKELLEHQSDKSYNPQKKHVYKVVDGTVAKFATKYKANIIIHGHTHDPNHYKVRLEDDSIISRIEIPDWVNRDAGGYVLLQDEQITIHAPNMNFDN